MKELGEYNYENDEKFEGAIKYNNKEKEDAIYDYEKVLSINKDNDIDNNENDNDLNKSNDDKEKYIFLLGLLLLSKFYNNKEKNDNKINKYNNKENNNYMNVGDNVRKIYMFYYHILFFIILSAIISLLIILILPWEVYKSLNCKIMFMNECIECNPYYELYNKQCITYLLNATYYTNTEKEKILLINSTFIDKIALMKIDDEFIVPNMEYTFQSKGEHSIYIYFKEEINSLSYMFCNIENLKEIKFHNLSQTRYIYNMSYMFSNSSLQSIDLSYFNATNVKRMDYMFYNCSSLSNANFQHFKIKNYEYIDYMFYNCGSLTSIDLSSFYTNKVNNMVNMFYNCYILAYVDISSFKTNGYKVKLFNYLPQKGILITNSDSYNNFEEIPQLWDKLNSSLVNEETFGNHENESVLFFGKDDIFGLIYIICFLGELSVYGFYKLQKKYRFNEKEIYK